MTIISTTDYSKFKFLSGNRSINPAHVEAIKSSIKKKNLLEENAIIVNKDFYIFEGQHRWAAAKELKLPIYYKVNPTLEKEHIILLNNNRKNWTNTEYLNFYVSIKDSNYMQLHSFMSRENLNLSLAINILCGVRQSGKFFAKFREGKYEFPTKERVEEASKLRLLANDFIEMMKCKVTGSKTYFKSVGFFGALISFLNNPEVDYERFKNKAQNQVKAFHPCTTHTEYVEMFEHIYNWKNKNPISILEEEVA